MNYTLITLVIIIAIIGIIGLWLVSKYNSFIKLRLNVEEAFSTMDVYLKKRFDLIPNLVETVKGYASHESQTLEKVIQARNNISNASSIEGKLEAENQLTSTLRSLFAVSEAYPDLKANENFIDLQNSLKSVEEDIAMSRKYYNGTVKQFNTAILVFPASIVANMFNFTSKPMFEVSDNEERENVKVQF